MYYFDGKTHRERENVIYKYKRFSSYDYYSNKKKQEHQY